MILLTKTWSRISDLTGSFNKIDYRLRPAKHAERSMLIDMYQRLRFAPIEDYQYVGFGSVAFVDFRMVHRSLGISRLISIEDTDIEEERIRFQNNKPFRNIDLRFGHSNAVLPTVDFGPLSIVWLDYDQPARRSMANDLMLVASRLKSGSFVAITFTNDFPSQKKNADLALGYLKNGFPEFVPDDAKPISYQGAKYSEFVRSTFGALLQTALNNADAGNPDPSAKRVAFQVCYFKYKDGAEMATIGWLVVSESDFDNFELCRLDSLPFFKDGGTAFRIDVPKITPFEVREIERNLSSPDVAVELAWIPEPERMAFERSYRYLPNFASVEAV